MAPVTARLTEATLYKVWKSRCMGLPTVKCRRPRAPPLDEWTLDVLWGFVPRSIAGLGAGAPPARMWWCPCLRRRVRRDVPGRARHPPQATGTAERLPWLLVGHHELRPIGRGRVVSRVVADVVVAG